MEIVRGVAILLAPLLATIGRGQDGSTVADSPAYLLVLCEMYCPEVATGAAPLFVPIGAITADRENGPTVTNRPALRAVVRKVEIRKPIILVAFRRHDSLGRCHNRLDVSTLLFFPFFLQAHFLFAKSAQSGRLLDNTINKTFFTSQESRKPDEGKSTGNQSSNDRQQVGSCPNP